MTDKELSEENHYRFEERLAIMCGLDQPTAKQICIAIEEAAASCDELRKQK